MQRSVTCLRLDDFLLNPSVETVQTLLLAGTYLQNVGKSDGAWSLLGLTFRLAQSLGLSGHGDADEHLLW